MARFCVYWETGLDSKFSMLVECSYTRYIALVRKPPWELNNFVFQQQQNLGRRFCASEMHLSPPPPPVAYAVVRSKAVIQSLLIYCLMYFPFFLGGGGGGLVCVCQ